MDDAKSEHIVFNYITTSVRSNIACNNVLIKGFENLSKKKAEIVVVTFLSYSPKSQQLLTLYHTTKI